MMEEIELNLSKRLDAIQDEIDDGASRDRLIALRQRMYRIMRKINEVGFSAGTPMADIYLRACYVLEAIHDFISDC